MVEGFTFEVKLTVTAPGDDDDSAALDALGKNAGAALVAPLSDTALGDFLQMGLIDTASLDFLALRVTLDGFYFGCSFWKFQYLEWPTARDAGPTGERA